MHFELPTDVDSSGNTVYNSYSYALKNQQIGFVSLSRVFDFGVDQIHFRINAYANTEDNQTLSFDIEAEF